MGQDYPANPDRRKKFGHNYFPAVCVTVEPMVSNSPSVPLFRNIEPLDYFVKW
jgi:hypothetical protein